MSSLPFAHLAAFFSTLEDSSRRDPPFLPATLQARYRSTIESWFVSNRQYLVPSAASTIDSSHSEPHHANIVQILSAIYPTSRPDRVYGIQPPRLTRLLKRCLALGHARHKELDRWKYPLGINVAYIVPQYDLGDCVESVLRQAEHPLQPIENRVTLDQVDRALARIAATCRYSDPEVAQEVPCNAFSVIENTLTELYRRMGSKEAKWLTRMLLKDLGAVGRDLEPARETVFKCVHPRLSLATKIFNSWSVSLQQLQGLDRQADWLVEDLCPLLGVKVNQPQWAKANGGIKHALSLINGRNISIERKYDGEYCQIHIDGSRRTSDQWIKIFSKSGKDSTQDRFDIAPFIKDSLPLGEEGFAQRVENCILEGELILWSEQGQREVGFHKIRKYVQRRGRFLGTDQDSPPTSDEHLMIIFHDLLLLNEKPILHEPTSSRRRLLENIIRPIAGRVGLAEREEASFSKASGLRQLKDSLARALAGKWEGLVLKPADEAYFSTSKSGSCHGSRWIKLKRDCIPGLGDTADFAVIGAGYDARQAEQAKIPGLRWTHYFLGCMTNRPAVIHTGASPSFFVVDCVHACISKDDLKTLNQVGYTRALDWGTSEAESLYDLQFVTMDSRAPKMRSIFRAPFIFEVAGTGFEKAPNRSMYTLRFPRLVKIRWDADWRDCVEFSSLQDMARQSLAWPQQDPASGIRSWVEWLERNEAISANARISTQESRYSGGAKVAANAPCPVKSIQPLNTEKATSQQHGLAKDQRALREVVNAASPVARTSKSTQQAKQAYNKIMPKSANNSTKKRKRRTVDTSSPQGMYSSDDDLPIHNRQNTSCLTFKRQRMPKSLSARASQPPPLPSSAVTKKPSSEQPLTYIMTAGSSIASSLQKACSDIHTVSDTIAFIPLKEFCKTFAGFRDPLKRREEVLLFIDPRKPEESAEEIFRLLRRGSATSRLSVWDQGVLDPISMSGCGGGEYAAKPVSLASDCTGLLRDLKDFRPDTCNDSSTAHRLSNFFYARAVAATAAGTEEKTYRIEWRTGQVDTH